MARIMIVEDERVLAKNVAEKLTAHGHEVRVVHTGRESLPAFSEMVPDVVLLDIRLPDADGLKLLPQMKAESPLTNFIVVTAHGSERIAVEAMKNGAAEYLTKPVDLDELQLVVARLVEHQQISDNLFLLKHREEQSSGLDRILGKSESIELIRQAVRRLTRPGVLDRGDPPTVLIMGETGTGKDLVARAIHYQGPRRGRPFIHVNCTALPASLFESELFGHVRGAFTSAQQAKRGLFEVAQGGTLFLDEIGHMEADIQAKLLHAIEHREIRPVGGTQTRPMNVHVVAATNCDLPAAVERGEFRRDLYHRLRVVEIIVPPLRERREDIVLLANHFLAMHCSKFGLGRRRFTDDASRALQECDWRGNVRELSHLIESCVLQADSETIDRAQLPLLSDMRTPDVSLGLPHGRVINMDFEKGRPTLDEVEHAILVAAFEYTGQNLSRAARLLGITREALRYRLNKSMEAARESV